MEGKEIPITGTNGRDEFEIRSNGERPCIKYTRHATGTRSERSGEKRRRINNKTDAGGRNGIVEKYRVEKTNGKVARAKPGRLEREIYSLNN